MKKVYVVQWSESSNGVVPGLEHGIEGIFADRHDAELCVAKCKHGMHYFIEEHEVQ